MGGKCVMVSSKGNPQGFTPVIAGSKLQSEQLRLRQQCDMDSTTARTLHEIFARARNFCILKKLSRIPKNTESETIQFRR